MQLANNRTTQRAPGVVERAAASKAFTSRCHSVMPLWSLMGWALIARCCPVARHVNKDTVPKEPCPSGSRRSSYFAMKCAGVSAVNRMGSGKAAALNSAILPGEGRLGEKPGLVALRLSLGNDRTQLSL